MKQFSVKNYIFKVFTLIFLVTHQAGADTPKEEGAQEKRVATGAYSKDQFTVLVLKLINKGDLKKAALYLRSRPYDAPDENLTLLNKRFQKALERQEGKKDAPAIKHKVATGAFSKDQFRVIILKFINAGNFKKAELYLRSRAVDFPSEDLNHLLKRLAMAKVEQVERRLPPELQFPSLLDDEDFTIDGDLKDWQGIKPLFKDFGGKDKKPELVDVGFVKMAYSQKYLYLSFEFTNLNELHKNLDILKIGFDLDANQNTGCEATKIYVAMIKGFEYLLNFKTDDSGQVKVALFSHKNKFAQLADWEAEESFKIKPKNLSWI